MLLSTVLPFLAQATQPASVPATGGDFVGPWYLNPQNLFLPLIVIVFIFLLTSSSRSKKKDQKVHDDMLANLKRGDRVQTVGGILGTVVEARDTDVVLKVDENSNTKIRFAREAIKRVLVDDDAAKNSVTK
jgi:preprotein translocase subunit YajC